MLGVDQNRQCPGALENATVDHYKSMQQDTSGKQVMLLIREASPDPHRSLLTRNSRKCF